METLAGHNRVIQQIVDQMALLPPEPLSHGVASSLPSSSSSLLHQPFNITLDHLKAIMESLVSQGVAKAECGAQEYQQESMTRLQHTLQTVFAPAIGPNSTSGQTANAPPAGSDTHVTAQ
eukprot:859755-Karenia_brevis.AAC.1